LLVLASTFPGRTGDGVPAFVLDIAAAEAEEFDVTVLTPQVPGAPRRERMGAVDVVRFRYFPARWEDLADGAILDNVKARRSRYLQVPALVIAQQIAVRRIVATFKPDAIHAHWVIPQGIAAMVSARRIPTLITTHGGDVYALNNAAFTRIKSRVLGWARAVTTVNADMMARLASWGIDESKLHLLPMGVPLDDVAEASAASDSVPGRILVVGRLVEKKGFGVLLAALRARAHDPEWNLRIVGDGPLREELQAQAFGLPVEFIGQLGRSEVLREMAEASIVAIPSISAASGDQEGLPVVLLEAAAMGRAIVASDLPGINEALTDGSTALLVAQGDVSALGSAIEALLADSELRERLGAAAAKRAADYGLTTIGAQYRRIIRSML
jgi:glycosyltransferase involved in cell wall biosynthesis